MYLEGVFLKRHRPWDFCSDRNVVSLGCALRQLQATVVTKLGDVTGVTEEQNFKFH